MPDHLTKSAVRYYTSGKFDTAVPPLQFVLIRMLFDLGRDSTSAPFSPFCVFHARSIVQSSYQTLCPPDGHSSVFHL